MKNLYLEYFYQLGGLLPEILPILEEKFYGKDYGMQMGEYLMSLR